MVLLPQKRFFFLAILKDFEFAVYRSLYKKDKGGDVILKRLQRGSDFPPENRITPLSKFAAKRSKDSRFSSYLPIENPSKRPEPFGWIFEIKWGDFFQRDSIPILVSRTVKTRKFKLLYFRNKTCYGNGNLYKDLLFVDLQPSVNKNS